MHTGICLEFYLKAVEKELRLVIYLFVLRSVSALSLLSHRLGSSASPSVVIWLPQREPLSRAEGRPGYLGPCFRGSSGKSASPLKSPDLLSSFVPSVWGWHWLPAVTKLSGISSGTSSSSH